MVWRPFLTLMSDPDQTVFVQDSTTVTGEDVSNLWICYPFVVRKNYQRA